MQGIWRVAPELEVGLLGEWPSCGLPKGEVRGNGDSIIYVCGYLVQIHTMNDGYISLSLGL